MPGIQFLWLLTLIKVINITYITIRGVVVRGLSGAPTCAKIANTLNARTNDRLNPIRDSVKD